jgi:hypothetical protein
MTLRNWLRFLCEKQMLDEALSLTWLEEYERLRYSYQELGHDDYLLFMKLFTALIKSIPS